MPRILVVGNQTLGSKELRALLQERVDADPATTIHLVVPQTPLDHYRTPVDGHQQTVAEHNLVTAVDDLGELGVEVTGEIGDEHPLQAVKHALDGTTCDEVVVSTLPEGISRWLGGGLTDRIAAKVEVPVVHVVGRTYDERRREARRYQEVRRQLGLSEA